MNTELFKQTLTEEYRSPDVDVIHIKSETILCGSFNDAQIPEYDEEDVWG